MSKANSRWRSGNIRYSTDIKIEDVRWILKRGVWRISIDLVSQVGWNLRRRERYGWRNGARIKYVEPAITLGE